MPFAAESGTTPSASTNSMDAKRRPPQHHYALLQHHWQRAVGLTCLCMVALACWALLAFYTPPAETATQPSLENRAHFLGYPIVYEPATATIAMPLVLLVGAGTLLCFLSVAATLLVAPMLSDSCQQRKRRVSRSGLTKRQEDVTSSSPGTSFTSPSSASSTSSLSSAMSLPALPGSIISARYGMRRTSGGSDGSTASSASSSSSLASMPMAAATTTTTAILTATATTMAAGTGAGAGAGLGAGASAEGGALGALLAATAPGGMAPRGGKRDPRMTEDLGVFQRLFEHYVPRVVEHQMQNNDRSTRVVDFLDAKELSSVIDLALPQRPCSISSLHRTVESTLKYSTRTSHPLFLDKLYAGNDSVGHLGAFLGSVLNTNVHTYGSAPVFSVMEDAVLRRLRSLFGLPSSGSGIMCPGGSYSNMLSMLCARARACPEVAQHGMSVGDAPLLRAFVSTQCHYSLKKAACTLGLGAHAVVSVPCDARGCMLPDALERALRDCIAAGERPFYVCAVAGTTVTGAIDPLNDIAGIVARMKAEFPAAASTLWMHVDGAWGGGLVASDELRHRLYGTQHADSVAFNPHKLWGLPLQNAALLTRDSGVLEKACSIKASYLFHDHPNRLFDLGSRTLQCGRIADAFRLFLSWRYHGLSGFATRVERAVQMCAWLEQRIKHDPRFRMAVPVQTCNVCFWWLPPALRDVEDLSPHYDVLDAIVPAMYEGMQRRGRILVNFNPLEDQGLPRFFRLVIQSTRLTHKDLEFVLNELDLLGTQLDVQIASHPRKTTAAAATGVPAAPSSRSLRARSTSPRPAGASAIAAAAAAPPRL